jgi:hypothetical protein
VNGRCALKTRQTRVELHVASQPVSVRGSISGGEAIGQERARIHALMAACLHPMTGTASEAPDLRSYLHR